MPTFSITQGEHFEELHELVQIQQTIWQGPVSETMPGHALLVMAKTGGLVLLARNEDGTIIGFLMALLAEDRISKENYLNMHMVGVLPEFQSGGVAYALHEASRAIALERGMRKMTWTFDPLICRNANLYLRKVGAVVDTFIPNEYGIIQSELYGLVRSDRFGATWYLAHDYREPFSPDADLQLGHRDGAPVLYDLEPVRDRQQILTIPPDILGLRKRDPALALEWQTTIKVAIERLLAAGFRGVNFRVDDSTGMGEYLFVAKPASEG
ncbi:MAG: GNAT family N-acetyltransferase [Fimbriimonas sp.]